MDNLVERLQKWPTPLHSEAAARIKELEAALRKSEQARADIDMLSEGLASNLGEQLDKAGAPRFGTKPEHGLPYRLSALIAALTSTKDTKKGSDA